MKSAQSSRINGSPFMPSRHIPETIRRELRREVNWGCPVAGCGSPFLSYHHFDPLFRDFTKGTEHRPDGIIALCLSHAGEADGGVFSIEQLRAMKRGPLLKDGQARGRSSWLRRNTVLKCGSNTFINISALVSIDDKKVVWFTRDSEGYVELSMNIVDDNGKPLFIMERNDWIASGPLEDLEAKPRGRGLLVKSTAQGFWLDLQFRDLPMEALRQDVEERALERERSRVAEMRALYDELRRRSPEAADLLPEDQDVDDQLVREDAWAPIRQSVTESPALEILLEGNLPSPVHMISSSKELRIGGITMTGSLAIGPSTVFHFTTPAARV